MGELPSVAVMAHPLPAPAILQPEAIDLLKPQSLSPKTAPGGRAETEITILARPEECSRILGFPFPAHNSRAGLRSWWGRASWACGPVNRAVRWV